MQPNRTTTKPRPRILIINKDQPQRSTFTPRLPPVTVREDQPIPSERSSTNSDHRITFSPFHKHPRRSADPSEGESGDKSFDFKPEPKPHVSSDDGSTSKGHFRGNSTAADYNCKYWSNSSSGHEHNRPSKSQFTAEPTDWLPTLVHERRTEDPEDRAKSFPPYQPVPHPAHAYTPRANYLLDGASIDRILDHSLVFDRRVKTPQNVLDRDAFNQHLREFQVKKFNLPETKIYRPNQSYLGKSVRSRRGSNEGSSRVGLFVDIALFFKGTRFVSRQSI